MGRQLREIALRRAELASRAGDERLALAGSALWSSGPFLIAERMLDMGQAVGSHSTILNFAATILLTVWPATALPWAARGLRILIAVNKIRKMVLK